MKMIFGLEPNNEALAQPDTSIIRMQQMTRRIVTYDDIAAEESASR